jgi:seryl-tRNA synthetase
MIRLEIAVEAMKKEIENSQNQAQATLDDLKGERNIWQNDLKAKSDKRSTDLAAAIQETKSKVQEEIKTLKVEKDKWNSELKGLFYDVITVSILHYLIWRPWPSG